MDKSIFETLNAINVGEHIEKKNGLSYLSWAWAWGELKKRFPAATYQIYENENGFPYFNDGRTCWVKTGVTIEGLEHIEYLPIMDFKNKSIPVDQVTSTDINKAIQRSLTKAIARHGLGLYIYAGEDLPEEETIKANEELNKKIAKKEADTLAKILNEKQIAWVLDTYHVNTLQELTCGQYGELMRTINERAANGK
jgi:hypothetical protein